MEERTQPNKKLLRTFILLIGLVCALLVLYMTRVESTAFHKVSIPQNQERNSEKITSASKSFSTSWTHSFARLQKEYRKTRKSTQILKG